MTGRFVKKVIENWLYRAFPTWYKTKGKHIPVANHGEHGNPGKDGSSTVDETDKQRIL